MRKPNFQKKTIKCNEGYIGERLEIKIAKFTQGLEPIESISPTIYTMRKDGVLPEHDIRTDKWDIAQNAMGQVSDKYREARKERLKAAEKIAKEGKPEAEA